MTTPTELLLKMMPPAVAAGKEALDKINRLGAAANRAQNPLTPTIIAAPIAKKGIEDAGEILNNKVISQQLDDPLIKAFAASNPFTGLLLGATGIARGFDSQSKIGKSAETGKPLQELPSRPPASGTKIKIDDKYYDTGYHSAEIAALRKKYPGGGNAAQSQSIDEGRDAYIPAPPATGTGPKLDPNATEQFKTAFNAGNNNMDQIQAMYADRPDLQKWAKANPALAQKEYLKKAFNTDGTPKILDKTAEGFDKPNAPGVVESIDGMQLPNSISINAGNELLDNMSEADDSQAFLKSYIMAMQNN